MLLLNKNQNYYIAQSMPQSSDVINVVQQGYSWGTGVIIWFTAAFLAVSLIAFVIQKSGD
jgi:LPS O-antigen subunit length determinant protein (WzzB/FepE family)